MVEKDQQIFEEFIEEICQKWKSLEIRAVQNIWKTWFTNLLERTEHTSLKHKIIFILCKACAAALKTDPNCVCLFFTAGSRWNIVYAHFVPQIGNQGKLLKQ